MFDILLEMKLEIASSDMVVASPEQCQMLLSTTYRYLVKELFHGPASLSQLADRLGLRMDTVARRLEKLMQMNLVHVVSEEARRGRAIKYYAMTAKSYKLPFENTPSATLEELIQGQINQRQQLFSEYFVRNMTLAAARSNDVDCGFILELRNGVLVFEIMGSSYVDQDPTIIYWTPVHLRRKDTTEFFKDITDVIRKYSSIGEEKEREEHLLGFQLVCKPT